MTAARKLERAAAAHRSTRDGLTLAVREARADGMSLRAIAHAADMSHEKIRRLTTDNSGTLLANRLEDA